MANKCADSELKVPGGRGPTESLVTVSVKFSSLHSWYWSQSDLFPPPGVGYVLYELVKASFPRKWWRHSCLHPANDDDPQLHVSCHAGTSFSWDQYLFLTLSGVTRINKTYFSCWNWLTWCCEKMVDLLLLCSGRRYVVESVIYWMCKNQ